MIENQEIVQMAKDLCEGLYGTSRNKNAKLKTQWKSIKVD